MGPLRRLQSGDASLVRGCVRIAHACPGAGLARDRERRAHADPGADRVGQDARRLPLRDRPPEREPGRGAAPALRLAAEGPELRRRAQPPRAPRGPRERAERRRPHRGHAAEGAADDAPQASGHPDHHARIALSAAHLARARDPRRCRDADPGRGARSRRHEARRPPRAQRRAARPPRRPGRPARGAVGDPAADGGDRPLRLGRPADRARGRRPGQGARPARRRPGRGHARARRRAPELTGPPRHGRRGPDTVDLALDLPRAAGAGEGAPLDDRLRQQPPAGRAARAAPQRARRGRDRPRPPRLDRPRAAAGDRGAAQAGPDSVPGRHLVARARDRHGRRRPRDPGRVAEVGRPRPAAGRARRPQLDEVSRGRIFPKFRADLLESAVVARKMRAGEIEETSIPRNPLDVLSQQIVAICADEEIAVDELHALVKQRVPLRGPLARPARERARHARRPLPVGRVRGAAAADRLGPHRRPDPGPTGRTQAGRHQRGHDPGPRPLRRPPRRRRRPRRRARRGDGLRGARGPDVPARRVHVADRGDHARPRARLARAGRSGRGAVLEGRGRRPALRARRGDRPGLAGAGRALPEAKALGAARRGVHCSTSGRRETCSRSCASRRRQRAWSPPTGRSSSSASATRSATGASASSRRSAAACTRRGRWRSPRGCASRSGSRCSRSGRTTELRCTCPTPTRRRRSRSC